MVEVAVSAGSVAVSVATGGSAVSEAGAAKRDGITVKRNNIPVKPPKIIKYFFIGAIRFPFFCFLVNWDFVPIFLPYKKTAKRLTGGGFLCII